MAIATTEEPEGAVKLIPEPRARGALFHLRGLDVALPASILGFVILACFAAPALFHMSGPNDGNLLNAFARIGARGHVLGTDGLGDDELARALFGGRASIEIGFGATALGLVIGGVLGVVAGFFGGWVESVVMRCLDMLLAFPALLLALCVAEFLGPSALHVIYAITFFTLPANARIARSGTLRVKQLAYVDAAYFSGRGPAAIIRRHVVPNVIAPLVTFSLLSVAIVMLIEAALSFLGAGIPLPDPSWGNMIAAGEGYLATDPGLVLIPAAFLFVTVLSLNLLGDALRWRWNVR
jgi:peptide/nickel transport system permease protein